MLPFTIVYLNRFLDASLGVAGLAVAGASLAGLVCGPVWGALIDRWSPRRVLIIGAVGQAGALALFTVSPDLTSASVALAVLGAAQSSAYPSQSSLFSELATGEVRARAFGLSFTFANLGICLGGLAAGAAASSGSREVFATLYLVDAATFIVLAIGVYFAVPRQHRSKSTRTAESKRGSYREVLRLPEYRRIFLVSLFLAFAGQGALEFGVPALVVSNDAIPISSVAYVFAVNTAVIVLVQPLLLGRVVRARRAVIFPAIALLWGLAAVLFTVLPVVSTALIGVGLLCLYGTLVGIGEVLLAPHLGPLTNELAPPHLRGRFNIALSTSFSTAYVLSPIVSTTLIEAHLSWLYAVIIVVSCLYVVRGARLLSMAAAIRPIVAATEQNKGATHV